MGFTTLAIAEGYSETKDGGQGFLHADFARLDPRFCAGVPSWLSRLRLRDTSGEAFKDPWGGTFRPDYLGTTEDHPGDCWVFELKYAKKGEPLALVQSLYYAHALSRPSNSAPLRRILGLRKEPMIFHPIAVTQWSPWLRGALDALTVTRDRHEPVECPAVAPPGLLEVTALSAEEEPALLWFLEYRSVDTWCAASPTEFLPESMRQELELPAGDWRMCENQCLFLPDGRENDSDAPRAMFARLGNQDSKRWLVWEGVDRRGSAEIYSLFDPEVGGRYEGDLLLRGASS